MGLSLRLAQTRQTGSNGPLIKTIILLRRVKLDQMGISLVTNSERPIWPSLLRLNKAIALVRGLFGPVWRIWAIQYPWWEVIWAVWRGKKYVGTILNEFHGVQQKMKIPDWAFLTVWLFRHVKQYQMGFSLRVLSCSDASNWINCEVDGCTCNHVFYLPGWQHLRYYLHVGVVGVPGNLFRDLLV